MVTSGQWSVSRLDRSPRIEQGGAQGDRALGGGDLVVQRSEVAVRLGVVVRAVHAHLAPLLGPGVAVVGGEPGDQLDVDGGESGWHGLLSGQPVLVEDHEQDDDGDDDEGDVAGSEGEHSGMLPLPGSSVTPQLRQVQACLATWRKRWSPARITV